MQLISKTTFNTSNDGGFGGWSGYEETYDNDVVLRVGHNHYRHTETSPANRVYIKISNDFCIGVSRKSGEHVTTLKDVEVISVWEYDRHYQALPEDLESLEKYGWHYNKIKTITL